MPRFRDPLHGIEFPGLRLALPLALLPFRRRRRLLVASLIRGAEASGVVRGGDEAEAPVGFVEEAHRVQEGGAGICEAVDSRGLQRPELIGDIHRRGGAAAAREFGLGPIVLAVGQGFRWDH